MPYALAVILAAVALATLVAIAMRISRGGVGVPLAGGWRWHPSLLGIAVVLLLGGLLLWRFVPELLFLPIIIPIFWWGRWSGKHHDDENATSQRRLPRPDDT
jgi:hypothetical protein